MLFLPSGVNLKIESVPVPKKRLPAPSKAMPLAWALMGTKIAPRMAKIKPAIIAGNFAPLDFKFVGCKQVAAVASFFQMH